jgi:hypothetical protein
MNPEIAWIEQTWAQFERDNPSQTIRTALGRPLAAPTSHEPLEGEQSSLDLFVDPNRKEPA